MKELGKAGVLVFTVFQDDVLRGRSDGADGTGDPNGMAANFKETYITPTILVSIALFCVFHVVQLAKKVRKQRAKKRKQKVRARFQRAVRRVIAANRLRYNSGRSDREQPAAVSVSAEAASPESASSSALRCEGTKADVPSLEAAKQCCLPPEGAEEKLSCPLTPQEQALASVLLGIEWVSPELESLAPFASITLTHVPECTLDGESSQQTRSLSSPPLKRIVSLEDGTGISTDKAAQLYPLVESEVSHSARAESSPHRGPRPHADSDIDEAPGDVHGPSDTCCELKRELAPASHKPPLTAHLPRIRQPIRKRFVHLGMEDGFGTSTLGVTSHSPHRTAGCSESHVGGTVYIPMDQAAQASDADGPSRHRVDSGEQVTFPSLLAPGYSRALETGQTGRDMPCSETRGGTAASTFEGRPAVVFPLPPRASPAAADLAACEVDSENGDSGSICTELSAALSGGAPYDSCESMHDYPVTLWPFTLVRQVPSLTDSALELDSDSDDSESGARFWPFALLPPIPMDEPDADMQPDGDGYRSRPEWEFVWA